MRSPARTHPPTASTGDPHTPNAILQRVGYLLRFGRLGGRTAHRCHHLASGETPAAAPATPAAHHPLAAVLPGAHDIVLNT